MNDLENFFLTEDDFDEFSVFLNNDFFKRDPLIMGFHGDYNCQAWKGRAGECILHCLRSGMSVGVRNSKLGEIVGMCGASLADSDKVPTPIQPEIKLEEAFRVHDLVMNQVYSLEKSKKMLMLMFLSVREESGQRGIAGKMVTKCIEAGIAKGAELACAMIVNVFSLKVFLKLGFEKRFTLEYKDDYDLDKSRMSGNDKAYLMTKRLS